jgi:hypothetical protein
MSRQFPFYLLPSDIEGLTAELRSKFGARVIDTVSPSMTPLEIGSAVRKEENRDATRVRCYIAPPSGAEIKTWYMEKRQLWAVDTSSEVIEFSGCDFTEGVLLIGRFYFETDMLIGDSIWRKRPEFLAWADKVFRFTKHSLFWSKPMMAYVGEDALRWRKAGGKFASFFANGKYTLETNS